MWSRVLSSVATKQGSRNIRAVPKSSFIRQSTPRPRSSMAQKASVSESSNANRFLGQALLATSAMFASYQVLNSDGFNKDLTSVASNPLAAAMAHQDQSDKIYSRAEVAKHDNKTDGYWVTFGDDVFDVSDFVEQHPGGDRILAGVGGPIDGYWAMYPQHKTKAVLEILMQYKIGKLDAADVVPVDVNNPYANDPKRSLILKPHTVTPYNSETVSWLIPDHFITPNDVWYVRHHHPVPDIKTNEFKLEVESNNGTNLTFSVDDLKGMFPKAEAVITLQCAGNRRAKYDQYGKTQGLKWDVGAISTARWGGVWLSDLLRAVDFDKDSAEHVQFTGGDEFGGKVYDASIPIHKAMSDYGDVLIAFEMNGEPIPREHGAPVRVLVPGHLAARSVKWLKKIRVSHEEAYSPWQRSYAYKSMGHQKSFKGVDASKLHSVQELPVQSAICKTEKQIEADQTETIVEGYAFSGGGRGIIRVAVSADGGETWTEADLKEGSDQPKHRAWAWTLWEATVPLPAQKGDEVQLCVKAVDASCNQQPKDCKDIWNLRGILNNSWHHVEVPVVPAAGDEDA